MSKATKEQVAAGQAVYTPTTLALYDMGVLGISNRLIWRCPTPALLAHYNQHITANHLDVGVGTGYFLAHCSFPVARPRIALMDLNPHSLTCAAARISHLRPETYQRNVLEAIPFQQPQFDSVGVNYLLHCLPGTMAEKAVLFDHLRPLLHGGAQVFGATLLQQGVARSFLARGLMGLYNRKGIFCNADDSLAGLEHELTRRFSDVRIEVLGAGALFAARVP